jgi:hypothetical protein
MSNAPPTTHRIFQFHKWDKEEALIIDPPFQRNLRGVYGYHLLNRSLCCLPIAQERIMPSQFVYEQNIELKKGECYNRSNVGLSGVLFLRHP